MNFSCKGSSYPYPNQRNTNHSSNSEFTNNNLYVLWYTLNGIQWELAFIHKRLMGDNIVQGVYKSTDMDMRDFWLFFLEIPNTLVQNIYDCQSGNMENHLLFTCDVLKYRMTCCNHHYGRTVPDYWSTKASLPTYQHKFFPDNFTQSMIGLPFFGNQWIAYTVNLRSKLKRGWLNLLDIKKLLLSKWRNVNSLARIRSVIRQNVTEKSRGQSR